jgi:predicted nucleic acid-binding protein
VESASLGIILDSSVIIDAERSGRSIRQLLEHISAARVEEGVGVSVVTIAELVHGAYRAKSIDVRNRRLEFIDRLARDLPVYSVTLEIARIAGRIEGESASRGVIVGFEDLLIGATAIHLKYSVATLNFRDFARIPGLQLAKLS